MFSNNKNKIQVKTQIFMFRDLWKIFFWTNKYPGSYSHQQGIVSQPVSLYNNYFECM